MNVGETEDRMVHKARNGDRHAFGKLVEQHWSRLVRVARSIVGEAEAEDAAQEGLLLAWRKLGSLREEAAFSGWLTRITVRICLQGRRKSVTTIPVESLPEPSSSEGNEAALDVGHVLLTLPPRQRAVMHLTIVEGMTDSEIGEVLGLRPSSVRAHRRRARESLSKSLRKETDIWAKRVQIL
jgi:RNA polymerase sigma-70 factor (ECF subfamily)